MKRISSPGSKNSVSTCTHVLFSIRNWVFVVSIPWLLFLLLLLFFNVICKVLEWDPERHLDLENKPTGNSKAILHSQCRYKNAPCSIRELFQDISEMHFYNTRSSASDNFHKQNSRLSIRLHSFSRIRTKVLIWGAPKIEKRQ